MTKTNNTVRINKMPIGALIGHNNNFVYLGRDLEAEAAARAAGHTCVKVNASCRRCGSVKTYYLNNLRSGNTKTCGCGRKKAIDTNKLIADLDRKFDDRAQIQENNPHKCQIISAEAPDGSIVSTMGHGNDEIWIKGQIMQDPAEAAAMRYAAYVADDELFGQTLNHFGDGQTKFADNRTVVEHDGFNVEVYEEYDGPNHSYNRPSPRDAKVEIGCVTHNKGIFRISTRVAAIQERDGKAFMALRQFALNKIRDNIVHNFQVGFNEKPTAIRVSKRRGIEEGIACEGKMLWCKMADISDVLAACC